jgi:transposase
MTVPGIGPIISSAMVAAIGNGAAFSKRRHARRLPCRLPSQQLSAKAIVFGMPVATSRLRL